MVFSHRLACDHRRGNQNFKLIRQREPDGTVDHIIGVFLLGPDGRELREYNGEILKANNVAADIQKVLAKG